MSKKRPENCPRCGKANFPIDSPMAAKDIIYRPWRYICTACNWIWANDLQRRHNEKALSRARKESAIY